MKKNNFRNKWRTLTEICQVLVVSAKKTGSILKEQNLRKPDGIPTDKSIKEHKITNKLFQKLLNSLNYKGNPLKIEDNWIVEIR